MTAIGAEPGPAVPVAAAAPTLPRRMACFLYEALLLFGLALIPGVLGAIFFAQTGQQHPLQGATALRSFAFVLFGLYFVWLWSARGQTLAMQTWRIRLEMAGGRALTQARALVRYLACCCFWFGPPTLFAWLAHLRPWPGLAAQAAWIAAYALSALALPGRQFWHDRLCGTRLVDVRAEGPQPVRPRPR